MKKDEQYRKEIQTLDLNKQSEIESKVQQILTKERAERESKYNNLWLII